MKILLSAALCFTLIGTAMAGTISSTGKLRLADASTDACFANCASQNNSCKRTCPATFSTPCLSSCDSQAQTCQRSCQR